MKILKYDEKFKKEIPELFTNCIHKVCQVDYTKEQLNAWANQKIDYKKWEKRLSHTKPFLVVYDKKLVGFAEFYDNYIDCFYVHENYQNKGIGRFLLNHILEIAIKNGISRLTVNASITSKPFFMKFGFIELKENLLLRNGIELKNFTLELNKLC